MRLLWKSGDRTRLQEPEFAAVDRPLDVLGCTVLIRDPADEGRNPLSRVSYRPADDASAR